MIEHEFEGIEENFGDQGSVHLRVTDEGILQVSTDYNLEIISLPPDVTRELVQWLKDALNKEPGNVLR